MTFIEKCCNGLLRCNQTFYCIGMFAMTSATPYQSTSKVDPLCTAEVDSVELADALQIGLTGVKPLNDSLCACRNHTSL